MTSHGSRWLSGALAAFLWTALAGAPALRAEAPAAGCPAVAGVESALAPGVRLVLLGEMHGTVEAPEILDVLVCHALESGAAVTVALEWPAEEEAAIEAYLASGGTPADREVFLATEMWHREFQDGRHSTAMLDLVERLRVRRAAGAAVRVAAFASYAVEAERERAMARRLNSALAARPGDLFIGLTGNLHNRIRKGAPWDESFVPMAMDLEAGYLSFELVQPRGTAWLCNGSSVSDCTVHPTGSSKVEEGAARAVTLYGESSERPYHGRIVLPSATASRPAAASGEKTAGGGAP